MAGRLLVLLGFLLVSVNGVRAATVCPWLTQGSAAKLLGGEVSLTVASQVEQEGSCTFSRQQGTLSYSLEVSVHKDAVAACPAGSERLNGIGNEALICRTERSSESVEEVSSRVRDLFFTVRLAVRGPKAGAMTVESQRDAVRQAAEQTAGNLF